jgi:predicted ArsR family transcriptional regulator
MSMVEDGRVATRDRILLLLRRHGRLSAPQLAGLLGVTSVGIRRHLTTLDRDGLVTATIEKPKRGRPTSVYRLTDAGLETFPRSYDEVAREALAFLGREDASALSQFLAWRNERLARSYAKRVDGATLAERATALAEVLSEQGFMAEVEATPEGLRLCQHNCTVEHLANELPDLCASEAKLFEQLLGTPVQRDETIVRGDVRCVTQVHERSTNDNDRRSKRRTSTTNLSTSPTHTPARSEA